MKPELTPRTHRAFIDAGVVAEKREEILSYQSIAYQTLPADAREVVADVPELFKFAEQHKATIEVLLLYLLVGGKCFADSSPEFPVVSPSSLRELSSLTGLHRETLRRRMADAEGLGLVQRISGGYVVSDVERWLRAVRLFRQQS